MSNSENILKSILDLFYPGKCLSCKNISKTILCPKCHEQTFSYYGESSQLNLKNYLALFKYSEPMRRMIEELKYKKNKNVAGILQNEIVKQCRTYAVDYIIPVPLNSIRLKERSFNQAQLLIMKYAQVHKIPVRDDIVFRNYNTKKLFDLDPVARAKQLNGSFEVWLNKESQIKNKNILIFDDILTTGKTITEIVKLLLKYEPGEIFVLAMSRPEIKSQ